jgi:hypothetical protein
LVYHGAEILPSRQRDLKNVCFAARQLPLDRSAFFQRGEALLRGGGLAADQESQEDNQTDNVSARSLRERWKGQPIIHLDLTSVSFFGGR